MKRDNDTIQPKGYGNNAKEPSGVKSSDATGERHGSLKNGIAMGRADSVSSQEFNGGTSKGICYTHVRGDHK